MECQRQILHIDARMYGMSGIGTYLQNLLPRMGALTDSCDVVLHGPEAPLEAMTQRTGIPYVVRSMPVDPYSLRRSLLPLGQPWPVRNLWVPHYNVPWLGVQRLIVTVHDILHMREDIIPRSLPERFYAHLTFSRVRRANAVAFVSEFTRDEFTAHVGQPRRGTVIRNGIDSHWFDLSRETTPRPLDFPYVFFIGNRLKHKNLSLLLDTWQELPEDFPLHLAIAGKFEGLRTPDTHPLLTGATRHPKVHLLGRIPQTDLEALMLHARALVFPSFYEGFGLPPLEAMACGTPVLCSDIPVFRELYGSIPAWFDPRSPASLRSRLLELTTPDTGDRTVRKTQARRFSWETAARKHMDLIRSVIGA